MPSFPIHYGTTITVPSAQEIADLVSAEQRVIARGVKTIRVSGIGPSPAASTMFIPNGPEQGYIWSLRLLSVQLVSSGTMTAYIASSAPSTGATPQRAIFSPAAAATQVTTFPQAAAMMVPGEGIYLSAAQNISAFFLAGWEVPAEMEYKLL